MSDGTHGGWPLPSPAEEIAEARAGLGEDLVVRLAGVELLVLDCDGVLTDGALHFGPEGEVVKVFNAQDGLGLMMLRMAGVRRAVLTGRNSPMVARRCRELKFESIAMGRFDKAVALDEIVDSLGLTRASALMVGDDLLDLPALTAAAVAVTVPAAPAEVRAACDWTTRRCGGHGAVREVCDLLLKSRGAYARAIRDLAAHGPLVSTTPGKDLV